MAERCAAGVLIPLLVLAIGACETQPEPERLEPPPPETPPSEPIPGAAFPEHELEHPTTTLEPVGESAVRGEVLQMREADALVLVVDVAGLPGEGEFPLHIHEGRCERSRDVHLPLSPVRGEPDGTGTSRTALDVEQVEGRILSVHLLDPGGRSIACADL